MESLKVMVQVVTGAVFSLLQAVRQSIPQIINTMRAGIDGLIVFLRFIVY
jgi:predicted AlkP superfamily phosphohydrolase/phosphomutase